MDGTVSLEENLRKKQVGEVGVGRKERQQPALWMVVGVMTTGGGWRTRGSGAIQGLKLKVTEQKEERRVKRAGRQEDSVFSRLG